MSEHLSVDLLALRKGGVDLSRWSLAARHIAARLVSASIRYQRAGGTGEMGEQWQRNYQPGQAQALEFLAMLDEVVGGAGGATLLTALVFDEADDEATRHARAK